MISAENACGSVADQEGEGVECAEVVLSKLVAKGTVKPADVDVGMTTPGVTEGALLVCAGILAPDDAEADEVRVSDAFARWMEDEETKAIRDERGKRKDREREKESESESDRKE